MASSSTRRMSWRALAPIVAIAAVGLSACTNSQEASDVPGTTPPVWTGSPAPEAGAHGETHATATSGESASQSGQALTATLKTAAGASAGTVKFTAHGNDVEVEVSLSGLPAGYRGVHVHSVGKCETNSTAPTGGEPGDFLSAGGHLQASGHTGMPESGDLGAFVVHEDGTATVTVTTDAFKLSDLQGQDGTAVVVHEETAGGARLACGVIG